MLIGLQPRQPRASNQVRDAGRAPGSSQRSTSFGRPNAGKPTISRDPVQDVLHSPGQPLEPTARTVLESRFGHDFSHVRVHTNAKAAYSARSLNARAYTVGPNIVFGKGELNWYSMPGRRLLAHVAHEIAHVMPSNNGVRRRTPPLARTMRVQRTKPPRPFWRNRDKSGSRERALGNVFHKGGGPSSLGARLRRRGRSSSEYKRRLR